MLCLCPCNVSHFVVTGTGIVNQVNSPCPPPLAVLEAVFWSRNLPRAIIIIIILLLIIIRISTVTTTTVAAAASVECLHCCHVHGSLIIFIVLLSPFSSPTPLASSTEGSGYKFHLGDHGTSRQLGEMVHKRQPLTSQRIATMDDGAKLGVVVVILGS